MQRRSIGPFQASAISLGCMNLSHAYGAPPAPEAAERLLLHALDQGVTMFDTAALYGFGRERNAGRAGDETAPPEVHAGQQGRHDRRDLPRRHQKPANYAANLKLLDGLAPLAAEAGCSMVQLALAWLQAQGDHIVPIPGTTSIAHLEENLGADAVTVSPAVLQRAGALINRNTVTGARYNASSQTEVDTEEL
jgi:aryl-alcohol dehydrogenase-like predicted oxidoreductase